MFVHEELQSQCPYDAQNLCVSRGIAKQKDTNYGRIASERTQTRGLSANLNLKQRRTVGYGTGEILTFTFRPGSGKKLNSKDAKSDSRHATDDPESSDIVFAPTAPLWSSRTGLGMRWIVVFSTSPCHATANIFDLWAKHVPSLIGQENYLDLAITYFIDSMRVFLQATETNERRACMTGEGALKSLRQTVSCNPDDVDPTQMLLAIALHRYAEVSQVRTCI